MTMSIMTVILTATCAITAGDHANIARETAKLIGLGHRILPATELWPVSAERNQLIERVSLICAVCDFSMIDPQSS
jgi:hypothetical protein